MKRKQSTVTVWQWLLALLITLQFVTANVALALTKEIAVTIDPGVGVSFKHDKALPTINPSQIGFKVKNLTARSNWVAVGFERKDGKFVKAAQDASLSLLATYSSEEGNVLVDVQVSRLKPVDVSFDLVFFIKLPEVSRFSNSINENNAVSGGSIVSTDYPLATVTFGNNHALAMGIDPHAPTFFEFGHSGNDGFFCKQTLAVSSKGPDRLKMRFVIFPVGHEWAFREALQRYFTLYRDLFANRVDRYGLWFRGNLDKYPGNKEYYRFREGDYTRLSDREIADDEKAGILSFPYIIVGQREIRLDQKNPTRSAALKALSGPLKGTQSDESVPAQSEALALQIEASGVRDKNGQQQGIERSRQTMGKVLTFPMNPNPWLHYGDGSRSLGAYSTEFIKKRIADNPLVDGVYLDSLYKWSEFLNYSPSQFAFARLPLTHNQQGQPALSNYMSHLEFIMELRKLMVARDRFIFGNGIRKGMEFAGIFCDILGLEGQKELDHLRAVAGRKPAVIFVGPCPGPSAPVLSPDAIKGTWAECLLYGIFPSYSCPAIAKQNSKVLESYQTYMPVLMQLAKAGWEPVTGIRSNSGVLIERYGNLPEEAYFVVYNNSRAPKATLFSYDTEILGALTGLKLRDHQSNAVVELNAPVKMPPMEVKVLKFVKEK